MLSSRIQPYNSIQKSSFLKRPQLNYQFYWIFADEIILKIDFTLLQDGGGGKFLLPKFSLTLFGPIPGCDPP